MKKVKVKKKSIPKEKILKDVDNIILKYKKAFDRLKDA